MSDALEPRDELTERLRAMGRQPIDPAVQSQHLTAMAAVPAGSSWRSMLASRVKLGTAVAAGFVLGATGLASAGAMGPLQPIAKTTVEAVTPFELPAASDEGKATAKAAKGEGKDQDDDAEGPKAAKHWGPECVLTFGGEPASQRNRGQYLKDARENGTPEEFAAARKSDCGKSVDALNDADDAETDEDASEDGATDGPRGKSAENKGGKGNGGDDDTTDDDTTDGGVNDDGVKEDRSDLEAGKSGVTHPPAAPSPADGRSGAGRDDARGDKGRPAETDGDDVEGTAEGTEDGDDTGDAVEPSGSGS